MDGRGRRFFPTTIAVVVIASSAGCSLLLSGDYSGANGPGPSDDGGGSSAEASDAVGVAPDSGSNSDAEADASTTRSCKTMPTASFCADFDEASTTPLALYWDEVSAASSLAAAPVRDESISVSKPHSLFFSTSPLAANESVSVSTKKIFTQLITSEVHLSFDVFHDQRDPGVNGYYLRLRVGPGATAERHKLYYYVSDDLAYIVEEPPEPAASIRHKFSEPVPTNKWVHIDIDAIRSGSSATVSARVDGAVAVNAEPLQGWRVGETELSIGITYAAGPSTAQKVHFDNIWADLK